MLVAVGTGDGDGSGPAVGGTRLATAVASRPVTAAARPDSTVASKSAVDAGLEVEDAVGSAVGTAVGVAVRSATTVTSTFGRGSGVDAGVSEQAAATRSVASTAETMTQRTPPASLTLFMCGLPCVWRAVPSAPCVPDCTGLRSPPKLPAYLWGTRLKDSTIPVAAALRWESLRVQRACKASERTAAPILSSRGGASH